MAPAAHFQQFDDANNTSLIIHTQYNLSTPLLHEQKKQRWHL